MLASDACLMSLAVCRPPFSNLCFVATYPYLLFDEPSLY